MTFDPLKIMLFQGCAHELDQQQGDFHSRKKNTLYTGKVLFPSKTVPQLKLNDYTGVGGQTAADVDTASLELKRLVSISSRHLPPCLFHCGESEPRGFNKAIISV